MCSLPSQIFSSVFFYDLKAHGHIIQIKFLYCLRLFILRNCDGNIKKERHSLLFNNVSGNTAVPFVFMALISFYNVNSNEEEDDDIKTL